MIGAGINSGFPREIFDKTEPARVQPAIRHSAPSSSRHHRATSQHLFRDFISAGAFQVQIVGVYAETADRHQAGGQLILLQEHLLNLTVLVIHAEKAEAPAHHVRRQRGGLQSGGDRYGTHLSTLVETDVKVAAD